MHTNKSLYCVLLIFFILIFSLTGCFGKKSETEIAQETADTLMKCIKNKDKETIKSLFSPYIEKRYKIDDDIDKMFEIFNSPIISDSPAYISASNESTRDGRVTDSGIAVCKDVIMLENGERYALVFLLKISNSNEKLIGLHNIIVIELDDDDKMVKEICIVGTKDIVS